MKTIVCSLAAIGLALSASAKISYLEYAEALDGAAAVNLGVTPDSNGAVEAKFSLDGGTYGGKAYNARNATVFCARESWDKASNFSVLCINAVPRFDYTGSGGVSGAALTADTVHVAKLDNGKGIIDGTQRSWIASAAFTVGGPICLFATYSMSGGAPSGYGNFLYGRIYYCKVYDADGTLVNDFRPAKVGDAIGFADQLAAEPTLISPAQGTLAAGPTICDHVWSEPVIVEATCTTDGSTNMTCTVCGMVSNVVVAAFGHDKGADGYCTRCHLKIWTSDFLQGLESATNRVASSPYATGGNIILKVGDDYVHIFAETNVVHSFVPAQTLSARVLAVGGGGAGGIGGGGGGAGGMVDNPSVILPAATYTVTVGAGGIWPPSPYDTGKYNRDATGTNYDGMKYKRRSGMATTLSNATAAVVGALGGGGGGSAGNKAGLAGGSGGGAHDSSSNAGTGTTGQGNDGSVGTSTTCGGGGGGAGAAASGLVGADGAASDILGFEQYFAGGGGAGCDVDWVSPTVPGGLGGGGRGAWNYNQNVALPGTDGLGGGGGGSGAQDGNAWCYVPGNGGTGLLVIRYTDPSIGGSAPSISLSSVTTNGDATATIAWSLLGAGDIAVRATYGLDADDLSLTNVLTTTAKAGEGAAALGGLLPGRTYTVAIFAENAAGEKSALSSAITFKMPEDGAVPETPAAEVPVISSKTIKDQTGSDYVVLEFALSQAGTGCSYAGSAATVRWGKQNSYAQMTSSMAGTIDADGNVSIRPDGLGTGTYYGCLEVVNENGYLDRIFFSFSADDASTYEWATDVADGNWTNRTSWTGAPNDWGIGYPSAKSTAHITSVDCATVHVGQVISCDVIRFEKNSADYLFVGDVDGAKMISASAVECGLGSSQTVVFDHLTTWLRTNQARYKTNYMLPLGSQLVLRNGASAKVLREGGDSVGFGMYVHGTLVVTNRSSLTLGGSGGEFGARYGGTVIIGDNSSVSMSNPGCTAFATVSTDVSVTNSLVFRGESPTLSQYGQSFSTQYSDTRVICEISSAGWTTRAAIRSTAGNEKAFGRDSNNVAQKKFVFSVPRTAPIGTSADKTAKESKLIAWSTGIDTNCVAFGRTARSADYFYYTLKDGSAWRPGEAAPAELPTGLWYHHEPRPGLCIVVR